MRLTREHCNDEASDQDEDGDTPTADHPPNWPPAQVLSGQLGLIVAEGGGAAKQTPCQLAVLSDPQPIPMHAGESEESQREVLIGGRLYPSLGLGKVLRHAEPAEAQETQIVLAAGMPFVGCSLKPPERFVGVLVDAVTLGIVAADPVQRIRVVLVRRGAEPFQRCL